jgi:hypothetical protein
VAKRMIPARLPDLYSFSVRMDGKVAELVLVLSQPGRALEDIVIWLLNDA